MLSTLELLRDEPIRRYEILDFKNGESFYFLKDERRVWIYS